MDNKQIVLNALKGVFVDRNPDVVELYFASGYVQHNPQIPTGAAAIPELISTLSAGFSYEQGMAVAEGDLVMVHGRYVGWAEKPLVGVDIFRLEGGKLVEHWDVLQEEVPAEKTVSGNSMFPAIAA